MELGGSDPFIVMEDADMDKTIEGAVSGRFMNCGQSCTSAKRFIVLKEIADTFTERFIEKAKELRIGDPASMNTDMGPLVREDERRKLEGQISESIKKDKGGMRLCQQECEKRPAHAVWRDKEERHRQGNGQAGAS